LKKYLWMCFWCISATVFAQSTEISGQVHEEGGIPLPGANLVIKGTQRATVTDFDGNFSIQASPGETLLISYIGYHTQEIIVESNTTLEIQLAPDTQALDEVVVVGYGTQKKSVVTGAISSIKGEDLEDLPITRVEQSLQGRTSGITIAANSGQPGSSSTVRVRGITTFGNNNPLWVVDGV